MCYLSPKTIDTCYPHPALHPAILFLFSNFVQMLLLFVVVVVVVVVIGGGGGIGVVI